MSIAARLCLIGLALTAQPLAAQWQAGSGIPLLEGAVRVRATRDSASGLAGWKAMAHGTVRFALVINHDGTPIEREVRTDELRVEVYGEAPNRSKQRIVAWRDSVRFPNALRYHRDHLGIVASDFGPIIRLGDGDEVHDVPHPLSARGLRFYQFALGDTVTVQGPGGATRVVAVEVRPVSADSAAAVGTLYLDADRATLVRFRFTFTSPSYRDATVEGIAVELENALIDGATWLPWRQSIVIRRADPVFGSPLGSSLRADWEIDDYELGLRLPSTTFAGAAIAGPLKPGFGIWEHPFQVRPSDAAVDIDEITAHARQLLIGGRLSGIPAIRVLGVDGISGLIRVDRVQGVRLGAAAEWQLSARHQLTVTGGIGMSGRIVTGGASLEPVAGGTGWHIQVDRSVIDLDDAPRRSRLVNSLATVVSGNDIGDWRLRDRIRFGLSMPAGPARISLDASAERHGSLASRFNALNGTRVANPALGYGDVRLLTAGIALGGWSVAVERGAGDADWTRATLSGTSPLPMGFEGSVRGGVGSAGLPTGRAFALGGIGTLPGIDDRSLWGRGMWLMELSRPIPLAVQMSGVPRAMFPMSMVSEITPFVAFGGVSGRLRDNLGRDRAEHGTVLGLRMSLGDPIARVTIGWHPASGGVLLAVDAHPLWWPLL